MTSRALFFKLMKEELRHKIWLIALSMLFFFVAMPLNIGFNTERFFNRISYYDSYGNMYEQTSVILYLKDLGLSYMVIFFIILAGVVIGFSMFAYTFSKKKVDFYHSLPVSRNVFFTMKYVSGLIIFLATFLINLMIAIIIGFAIGVPVFSTFSALLYILLGHLLGFFVTYTMAVCCALLCGNLVVSGLLMMLFSFLPYMITTTTTSLAARYFITYSNYSTSFKDFITGLSPVWRYTAFFNGINFKSDFSFSPSISRVIYLLAACILLVTAAYLLFRFRPSEAAGNALAFRKSIPPLRFLTVLTCSLVTGTVFEEMSTQDSQDFWRIFGFAFGFLLSWMIVNTIIYFDFKKSFTGPVQMGIAALTVIIIFCTFSLDLIGYDKYQPKQKNLTSIGINISRLSNNNCYWDYNDSYYNPGGLSQTHDVLDEMQIQPELIYDLADDLIEITSKIKDEYGTLGRISTIPPELRYSTLPYKNEEFTYASCLMKYEHKNGHNTYREYRFPVSAEYLDWIKSIFNNQEYKRVNYEILTVEQAEVLDVYAVSRDYQPLHMTLTQSERSELYSLCQEAYRSLEADQLITDCPIGQVYFVYRDTKNQMTDSTPFSICEYIYPSFTKVISFLQAHGINFTIESETIGSLVVSKPKKQSDLYFIDGAVDSYEEYLKKYGIAPVPSAFPRETTESVSTIKTYDNEDYTVVTYYDQASIKDILAVAVPARYLSSNVILQPQISDCMITITWNVDEYGNTVQYQYRIPEEKMPEFLVEDLKTP